jgi:hypothetical protein
VAFLSRKSKSPAVSAELGRPETPEETAARKAEQSRLYRARKTINNLVYSLLVTVGLAVGIYLLVPHSNANPDWVIDYVKVGAQIQQATGEGLDIPTLPTSWRANQAKISGGGASGPVVWRVGFITPTDQFISFRQAIKADASWVPSILKGVRKTGTRTLGGLVWQEFDNRSAEGAGNLAYALVTVAGGDTYLLNGTAPTEQFTTLATAVAKGIPE